MVFLRFRGCAKPESHGLAIGTGFGVVAVELEPPGLRDGQWIQVETPVPQSRS